MKPTELGGGVQGAFTGAVMYEVVIGMSKHCSQSPTASSSAGSGGYGDGGGNCGRGRICDSESGAGGSVISIHAAGG